MRRSHGGNARSSDGGALTDFLTQHYRKVAVVLFIAGLLWFYQPTPRVGTAGARSSGPMTVVVTGGLGFIGSHVVEALLEEHAQNSVIIIDNESTGHNYNTDPRVLTVIGDITSIEDLAKLPSVGVDYVIHLAAAISVQESLTNPEKYTKNNVEGSRNVLEWARQHHVKHVVSASSAAVYGDPQTLPVLETTELSPLSPYADTKVRMEGIHREYAEQYDFSSTCTRFFNVYGPRQDPKSPYSGVVSKFIDCAVTRTDINIFGDGAYTRDFVYVRDIAAALISVLRVRGPADEGEFAAYNVGTERITTINKLAETILSVAGATDVPINHLPPKDGDVKYSQADIGKIEAALGYEPQTTLAEGLAKTYEWYIEANKAGRRVLLGLFGSDSATTDGGEEAGGAAPAQRRLVITDAVTGERMR